MCVACLAHWFFFKGKIDQTQKKEDNKLQSNNNKGTEKETDILGNIRNEVKFVGNICIMHNMGERENILQRIRKIIKLMEEPALSKP